MQNAVDASEGQLGDSSTQTSMDLDPVPSSASEQRDTQGRLNVLLDAHPVMAINGRTTAGDERMARLART
jgi:hypothetical protein